MADAENATTASRKRVAGNQISKDNPSLDDDMPEPEMGTFQRASEEVLATRRIVKVRRQQPASNTSSNPFAGISFVSSNEANAKATAVAEPHDLNSKSTLEESNGAKKKHDESERGREAQGGALLDEQYRTKMINDSQGNTSGRDATDGEKVSDITVLEVSQPLQTAPEVELGKNGSDENSEVETGNKNSEEANGQAGDIPNDASLESKKAAGEKSDGRLEDKKEYLEDNKAKEVKGEASSFSSFRQLSSSQNAFTGLSGTGFGTASFSFGSSSGSSFSSFSFGSSNNGNSSFPLFNSSGPDAAKSGAGGTQPSLQEVQIETGEENEKSVFAADATLYEYLDGAWKERGKGEIKVNTSVSGEKARLVMRAKGNYRLILNASLFPDMKLTNMDKKGVTFACINSVGEGKSVLATFALKFKDSSFMEEFCGVVSGHKGKKVTSLKTPKNSPKDSEE
ncbi:Ran-binding protein 1 like b [Apostasia shenzhenica]|uniref:Ran-binding protein 1 like b n=1 Tax=Apostasia shenzhenica TaxID=1088818 RepID=A0A2I0B9Q3_9ASPA|nr:Ran-binding protein 1 like b [Apostasia shenzhenica]